MFKGVNILYRNVLRLRLMRNAIITTLLKKNCSLYALNEKRRNM